MRHALELDAARGVEAKDETRGYFQDGGGHRNSDNTRFLLLSFSMQTGHRKLICLSTLDAAPPSLLSVLAQNDTFSADERPTKRRKVAKSGPRSLVEENGLSSTGIPLGFIPLARLVLRIVSIDPPAAVEVAC